VCGKRRIEEVVVFEKIKKTEINREKERKIKNFRKT
jgi:hypothetical protein